MKRGRFSMNWRMKLLFLMGLWGLALGSLSFERSARAGGGDFTLLNSIVNELVMPVDLDIEPKEITVSVIKLRATVGDKGECKDFGINGGGDIEITGQFLSPRNIDGKRMEVYEVSIDISELNFECTIPLRVKLRGPILSAASQNRFGSLTFESNTATLTQTIRLHSPDFQTTPPVSFDAFSCSSDPGKLHYSGKKLGSAFGIDITKTIVKNIRENPNYVYNDVKKMFCEFGESAANALGAFMIDNILTDPSSGVFIQDPFVPDKTTGKIPALLAEEQLRSSMSNIEFLNYRDSENFVVRQIIPDDPTTDSVVNTILKLIADPDDESKLDPLLLFAKQEFPFPLQPDGTVRNWDFLGVLNGTFFDGDENNGEFNDFKYRFSTVVDESLDLRATVTIDSLNVNVFPKLAPDENSQQPPILPSFQVFGENTLLLDGVDLNDVHLDFAVTVELNVENKANPESLFLSNAFKFSLKETFKGSIDWEGFLMKLGLLLDLDLDAYGETQIQSFLDSLMDCSLAMFPLTPRVTGALLGHTKLRIQLEKLFDAFFVLVADVVDVMVPIYQATIPKALELIVDATLTNQQLFDPATCPLADPAGNDIEQFPYNFSEGIVGELSDFLDADTVNRLAGDGIGSNDAEIFVFGSEDGSRGGFGFTIPIPNREKTQDMTFEIRGIALGDILLPHFNELQFLKVIEDSQYAPQELRTLLDVGNADKPIILRIILAVTFENPANETDVEDNIIDLHFNFERVSALLDLYLHFSQYDVDSMSFDEVLNPGCWVERLKFPGGITDLKFVLENVTVTADCDCQNEMALALADTMRDKANWNSELDFIADFLVRSKLLLTDIFQTPNFEHTVERAEYICRTGDFTIEFPDDQSKAYHTPVADLVPYIGFFGVAVLIPSLFAAILKHCGPKLKKANKNKFNHYHNKMATLKNMDQEEIDDQTLDNLHLTTPLWKNPLVPRWAQIGIPISIFINIILFLIGDTGNAVSINLIGQVMGEKYIDDGFGTLSVIKSVVELWKSGGYLLASVMFIMSVSWPYFKLLLITFCWFLPIQKLSVKRRGTTIEILDIFGRFSFAEFHFLVFVLVVFQLRTGTPDLQFLPEQDLFSINLDIEPQTSLFTFALAVVLSIVISNVLLVLQHNIEDESRIKLREKHLLEMNANQNIISLVEEANNEDEKKIRMSEWNFHSFNKSQGMNYTFKLTPCALIMASIVVSLAFVALLLAASVDSISIELRGFFSYLVLFETGERDYSLSVFKLFIRGLQFYKGNGVIYVVGLVFISTIAIIPLLQTILLFYLLFKPMTVKKARRMAETHHIISVWCCVDVFVLAVSLTVLELPTVAEGLQGTLGFCGTLASFMEGILVPMQLVQHEDAVASCLSLRSFISTGAYLAVVSVLVLNLANIIVSKLFFSYIVDREGMVEFIEKQQTLNQEAPDERPYKISSWHKKLVLLGLIKVNAELENRSSVVLPENEISTLPPSTRSNPLASMNRGMTQKLLLNPEGRPPLQYSQGKQEKLFSSYL